jgi:MOSC domain-containing protein YiiM
MNQAHPKTIEVRAVAVGQPAVIGQNRKGDVISGIRKRFVSTDTVRVGALNIEGDGQADLKNHGGPDKAVYCYPAEHLPFWKSELGYDAEEAPFGENLSTRGITEEDARIGDIWRWGSVVLQISQPRWPCYKLALHSGHVDMIKRFVESGRSGWYLRVLEPGAAKRTESIILEQRDPASVSVRLAFDVARGLLSSDDHAAVNAHPALAKAWRR